MAKLTTRLLGVALLALVLPAAAAPSATTPRPEDFRSLEEPPPFACPICGGSLDDFQVVFRSVLGLQVRGLLFARGV